MSRHVRGILFVDYVRIIRAFKEASWSRHLLDEDQIWLTQEIKLQDWYPMPSYERMGLAILAEVAGGSFSLIRRWGRETARALHQTHPHLVVEGDARETFRRFDTLSETLFDFPALSIRFVNDGEVHLEIGYGMSPRAEEAACHQTLGFIEQLLESSGAEKIIVEPISRSWTGDARTVIRARWLSRW